MKLTFSLAMYFYHGIIAQKHMKKYLLSSLAIILLTILGIIFYQVKTTYSKVFVPTVNQNILGMTNTPTKKGLEKPINILLLGYGGGGHTGGYLTDTIILTRIDPQLKKVTMITIPRDLWVSLPVNKQNTINAKINAAYAIGMDDKGYPRKDEKYTGPAGGGSLAKDVVQTVTGLPVDRFVAIDFSGFKKSIDVLGGVDLNVETAFDDYEYPIDGHEDDMCGKSKDELISMEQEATISAIRGFPCRFEHLHFDQGLQHMDGTRALKYVRSRHSLQDGTDFGRSKRQRNLIMAVKDKILSVGFIPKIIPFITSLQDDVRTDFTLDELKQLLDQKDDLSTFQVSTIALSNQNVLMDSYSSDGQAILSSKEGLLKYIKIQDFIASYLNPQTIITTPTIQIENATKVRGLAGQAVSLLQNKDYHLLPAKSAAIQSASSSAIVVSRSNIDPKILDELKTQFGVSQVSVKDESDADYDILITLGSDFAQIKDKEKKIN